MIGRWNLSKNNRIMRQLLWKIQKSLVLLIILGVWLGGTPKQRQLLLLLRLQYIPIKSSIIKKLSYVELRWLGFIMNSWGTNSSEILKIRLRKLMGYIRGLFPLISIVLKIESKKIQQTPFIYKHVLIICSIE